MVAVPHQANSGHCLRTSAWSSGKVHPISSIAGITVTYRALLYVSARPGPSSDAPALAQRTREKVNVVSPNTRVGRLVDPDRAGSLTHRCRLRRTEEFRRRFPDLKDMRVLDLGGTAVSWRVSGMRADSVTIVNLDNAGQPDEPWMEFRRGDACAGGFGKYDLVFSNSLIEHLGGHARRQQFADVVQESAPMWWVQTPYRYFPIEPHWVFPGFQFLPFRTRVFISQHWNAGHLPEFKNVVEVAELVASTELISATEMRAYFPSSEIWFERIAGLPKSLTALKTSA